MGVGGEDPVVKDCGEGVNSLLIVTVAGLVVGDGISIGLGKTGVGQCEKSVVGRVQQR